LKTSAISSSDNTQQDSILNFASMYPILATETVYSWCARIHRLIGHENSSKTYRLLFEHNSVGICHDFPSKLSLLIKNTSLPHNPESLVTEHTALGFYKSFLTEDLFSRYVNNALFGGSPDIKTLLGVNKSGALYPFALKYCHECAAHSIKHFGYSIWKTNQQWPSVHICDTHHKLLTSAPNGFHNKTLKKWYLPHDGIISLWPEQTGVTENTLVILSRISKWSTYLRKYNNQPLDSHLLKTLYHLQARNHGFFSSDGLLMFQQFRKAFIHEYKDLTFIKGFEFLNEIHKEHGGVLGVILKKYSGDRFPLKHILMIDFLFSSPASFSKNYHLIKCIENS